MVHHASHAVDISVFVAGGVFARNPPAQESSGSGYGPDPVGDRGARFPNGLIFGIVAAGDGGRVEVEIVQSDRSSGVETVVLFKARIAVNEGAFRIFDIEYDHGQVIK